MEIFKKPLKEIHEDLVKKKISVKELVQVALDRIKETDEEIRSFLTVRTLEDLSDEIEAAQKSIDSGKSTILTGIPYSAKDIFVTKGIRTTAGSKTLDNFIPQYTATVIERLFAAGAIMVGKTNLDAFAHGSSTMRSDYFTSHNPWDLTKIPGGSSGGSASSVAALQVPFSIGSETGGSIRHPSSLCGVTGLKGTYGRTSRYGVIAMGSSLDCPGPIARTAEDAGIIMHYLSGQDKQDSTTVNEEKIATQELNSVDLKGVKVGIPRQMLENSIAKEVMAVFDDAVIELKKAGAEIIDVEMIDAKYAISVYAIISSSEISSNLARWHGTRFGAVKDDPVETVYDLFKNNRSIFGYEAKRRQMIGSYSLSTGYFDKYYRNAQKVRSVIIEDFNKIFSKVDLLLMPTTPGPAVEIGDKTSDPMFAFVEDALLSSSTMAGLPGISVPMGFVDKLPVGLQFIAPQKKEINILEAANVYQKSTDWHNLTPYDK